MVGELNSDSPPKCLWGGRYHGGQPAWAQCYHAPPLAEPRAISSRVRLGPGAASFMDTAHTLVVPASADGLREAEEGLDDFSAAHGLTRNDTWPFHVAIDEILSNIVKYGLGGERSRTEVQIFLLLEEESLEMVILDDAEAFNPLDAERPDTVLAAADREIGGLGIEIVRRLMDSIEYERLDDRHNRLTLRRRLGL